MDVNYAGMVHLTKLVLPGMMARGGGTIVNIGSIMGGLFAFGNCTAYAAAKAAVDAYTQILQLELRGSPVRAVLVRPAMVRGTSFFAEQVDERLVPKAAALLPTFGPAKVARKIVRGIESGRDRITVPGYFRALMWANGLAPFAARRLAVLSPGGRA